MKKNVLLLGAVFLMSARLQAASNLDLEMTGPEYLKLFNAGQYQLNFSRLADDAQGNPTSAALQNILKVGKRNLEWYSLVNANRPADHQLELYTPALQTGIPIDHPKEYNEKTVTADYDALVAQMPDAFKIVLLADTALPTNHPMATDDEYLDWTRRMDKVYQSASRWLIMVPNLFALAARSYEDIRGYYFLSKVENLGDKLNNWAAQSDADKTNFTAWLISECHNSRIETAACRTELNRRIQQNKVLDFHNRYLTVAKSTYDNYFLVSEGIRSDVQWTSADPLLMSVPFATPARADVKEWLSTNIEDEWKWNDWHLRLNFVQTDSDSTTHVIFQDGATPHVNDIGGSEITMDANRALQDYSARWTIRHEYGHTLGFPDCYVEFYDTDRKIIINYQLDLDNLMCSRKGHMLETHYKQVKKVYFKE